MKGNNLRIMLLLFLSAMVLQSCSKDAELLSVDESRNERGGDRSGGNNGPNGGNNGPNGGNNDNGNVDRLDNEIVYEWTELLLNLERYAGGMRPNASARALAYISLAGYETAVPGMRGKISNSQLLPGFNIDDNQFERGVNFELALNAAYADVLDHFLLNLPSNLESKIGELEEATEERLTVNMSDRRIRDSKEWGAYVANQVIAYSQTDTEAEAQILQPQPLSYEPPTGDGYWTYSAEQERALFPYWASVRTFVVGTNETTTRPPIPYSENPNSPYFREMEEVYQVNNTARAEDNEQLWIAEFWSDDVEGLMFSPPARQYSIANQLIDQRNLSLEQTLLLYVKLGFALNDAAVSTWKYKYEHMVMRPNVYIHEFIDPNYQTNLYSLIPWPNPTFPGYPSGHSCFASAAAGVFIDFFGNQTNFTDRSHEGRTEFRGAPRKFNSFEQMARENAFSRIPLGVHIRMDCTEGLRLGYEISDGINAYDLSRPNS